MGSKQDAEGGSFYITKKLIKKLEMVSDYRVTIVDAPTGFGKTIAVKEYLKNSSRKCEWINVMSSSKDIFWSDFCDLISGHDRDLATELRSYDFPSNEKNIALIRSAIKRLVVKEETYVAIDNYQLIQNVFSDLLINYLLDVLPEDMHIIFITQSISSPLLEDLINKKRILRISTESLVLQPEDIQVFFAMHNQMITSAQANKLYEYTEGWISAINLQMMHYAETGVLDDHGSMEALVDNTLWEGLMPDEKTFLISLVKLDNFNIKEARMMASDSFKESEVERILNEVVFIRFDLSNRYYYIHHVLQEYLAKAFLELSREEQQDIIIRTGHVYMQRGLIFSAYQKYYEANAWELIYQSVPEFDKLYPYINKENKAFFIDLVNRCPEEIATKYYYFPIIMCLVLFMYNEKERQVDYLLNIVYAIEDDEALQEHQKKNLLGTVYFIRAYTEFNNISVMKKFYKKSLDYGGLPVINLTNRVPFSFGCPSVLHLYHREGELLNEELNELVDCLPDYYRLSEGHGKGADAYMKAEILFNQGDLDGAETLCHKALYMADSREQTCITLGALLLLTRRSVFQGDYEAYHENIEAFRKKIQFHNDPIDSEYVNMIEMCESYLYANEGDKDKISEWLKDWDSIEKRLNIISLSYGNIIYSKYLYLNGEYQKFLGISGQFLGIASIFSNAMSLIYTYIFIALCNKAMGNEEKADKFLRLALGLSTENELYMPFVENMEYMEDLIERIGVESEYRDFVKKLKSIYRKYAAGLKSIVRNARNKDNYGLTQRELDVAKLAAKRFSNKEIAAQLYIAESTVKSNLKIIFNKLNINSRSELSKFF